MNKKKVVCVQGLGFVGSAMALAVASSRDKNITPMYDVIGIDVETELGKSRIDAINKGRFPFENNDLKLQEAMEEAVKCGNLTASSDERNFSKADVVIVDINLDIKYSELDEPILDLTMFKEAIRTIGKHVKENVLIIVETTVPPGACENVVKPIISEEMKKRGLNEKNIYIAHSYERVMPGAGYFDSIVNFWRVYSGIDSESADKCEEFLKTVISTEKYPLTRLKKTTSTEIAKVLENSYRATTIAFMEEWGRFAEAVNVDLFEVIDAIRMRPTHSNMRQPGFGVGGYCLTKDPYFAQLAAKDLFGLDGMNFPFCTMAVKTNKVMPLVSLNKIDKLLDGVKGKKMLILGVSYRQDVGDTRYSPTETFVIEAKNRGAIVTCHDPLVNYWHELKMDVLQKIPEFSSYDVIVFTVQHSEYKCISFANVNKSKLLIFDANAVLTEQQIQEIKKNENLLFAAIGK